MKQKLIELLNQQKENCKNVIRLSIKDDNASYNKDRIAGYARGYLFCQLQSILITVIPFLFLITFFLSAASQGKIFLQISNQIGLIPVLAIIGLGLTIPYFLYVIIKVFNYHAMKLASNELLKEM